MILVKIQKCKSKAIHFTKSIPTAEDTYKTENRNPYFCFLYEMSVMWRPLV